MTATLKTIRQHKDVAQLALTIDFNGKIELRSRKNHSGEGRWFEYPSGCDRIKEFATIEEAEAAALKCCPVFYGTAGPMPQYSRCRMDRSEYRWISF